MKARELLERQKTDLVSQAAANLLFKSLSITRDEILLKYKDFKLPQQSQGYVVGQFPRLSKRGGSQPANEYTPDVKVFTTQQYGGAAPSSSSKESPEI